VIDVGVDADLVDIVRLQHAKVRRGTRNFAIEPAMTLDELDAALEAGAAAARRAADDGVQALGLGEMGIGNTTAAAALLSCLTRQTASVTVGRGTGVRDDTLAHKRVIVDRAIRLHELESHGCDAREWLRCVGGLEIAAIAGAAIEAARRRLVVIADGFISTVAVACAAEMAIGRSEVMASLRDALFFAHRSTEIGHTLALETCGSSLGVDAYPVLDLGMRLGEGTGAALAVPVLRAAAAVMREMATFESAGVSAGRQADAHRGPSGE
jgi:nicotinate-nucleotide--dimethylbenzimidazole phosphoribosyltransferase